MTTGKRAGVIVLPTLLLGLLALCSLASISPAAAATTAPAASDYLVRPLCATPEPGHAGCLGLRLKPRPGSGAPDARTLLARARSQRAGAPQSAPAPQHAPTPQSSPAPQPSPTPAVEPAATPKPLTPAKLSSAYALPSEAPGEPTIAIVDAYDDPTAEADLAVFDEEFGLSACTSANGCFKKVNGHGQSAPLPAVNGGWAGEIATDVEVAHSLCQNCRIVLVEASSDTYTALETAEETAAAIVAANSQPGSYEGAVSNSWGGEEPLLDSGAFDHPGLPITASSGDDGYLNWDLYAKREEAESPYFDGPDYPASSPHVIAVGGTSLSVNTNGEWASERVWNNSSGAGGGGCSERFLAPAWQTQASGWSGVGCGLMRGVADVAADADPYTGVWVYDSTPEGETAPDWEIIGGTSVASPIVATAFALAGGGRGVAYPAATLYSHAGSAALHDVTVGGNGECDAVYGGGCSGSLLSPLDCGSTHTICNAAVAFDGPTGVGTAIGLAAFEPLPPSGEGSGTGAGEGGGGSAGEEGSGGGGGGSGGGVQVKVRRKAAAVGPAARKAVPEARAGAAARAQAVAPEGAAAQAPSRARDSPARRRPQARLPRCRWRAPERRRRRCG